VREFLKITQIVAIIVLGGMAAGCARSGAGAGSEGKLVGEWALKVADSGKNGCGPGQNFSPCCEYSGAGQDACFAVENLKAAQQAEDEELILLVFGGSE
jgi:hypothetical protein